MNSSLKHYSWSAINKLGSQVVGFAGNIFIARQLTPDDYGLVGMISIFLAISWCFTESGLADYILSNPKSDKKVESTVFVFNIFVSLLLYAILFLTAQLIADFFNRSELVMVIRILGLSIFLRAITFTHLVVLQKKLYFRELASVNLISSISSVVIGYIFALNGAGYWAIVIQNLWIPVAIFLQFYFLYKWRPSFAFDCYSFNKMKNYSFNLLIAFLAHQISKNIHSVIIGKFLNPLSLGYYTQSGKVSDTVFQGLNSIVVNTSYSLLALEEDSFKRREMLVNVLTNFSFIYAFIVFWIWGGAQEIMPLVFGSQWKDAYLPLQFIMLSTLLYPFTAINYTMAKVLGKATLYRNLTFFNITINILVLLFLYKFSLTIILIGLIFSRFISSLIDMYVCGKYIGISFFDQLKIFICNTWIPLILGVGIKYIVPFNHQGLKLALYSFGFILLFVLLNFLVKSSPLICFLKFVFKRFE